MKLFIRAVLGAILSLSLMLTPGLTWTATAAAAPVVTKVGPRSGPLKPTVITLKGKHLKGVKAVRFGTKKAKIVKRLNKTSLRVRTPKGMHPGKVAVLVRTKAGWSKKTKKARYTFIARPKVTRLSKSTGLFTGGQRITIRGKFLKTTQKVTFGGQRAKLGKKTNKSVVVTTPVGTMGRVPVKLTSRGGVAKKTLNFTYVAPPTSASARLTPKTAEVGSAQGSSVQWVTGGLDPDTNEIKPWVVSLAPGSDIPQVGKGFIVSPGTPAFPSGLTGTVTDIAVQVDESIRVTVAPTDVTSSVKEGHLSYSGPVSTPATTRHLRSTETEHGSSFSLIGPTALFCKSDDGQSVTFGSSLTTTVEDQVVDTNIDWGGLFRKPKFEAAYSDKVTVSGKFSVDAAATCKIKPEWANAQRKIIPLGTSGATLSVGPTFEVKFSGKGTYSIDQVTANTLKVSAEVGSNPRVERVSRSLQSKHGGALSFEAELTGGVSVQVGFLDRAGVEGKALLGANAGVTATSTNVCVAGKVFLRFGVGLFLDAFVARWDYNIASITFNLVEIQQCSAAVGPAPATAPEITSYLLPNAQKGTAYSTALTTADNRAGTWSVIGGQLPPGTSLSGASGEISGTPTTVGSYWAQVRFTDGTGGVAESTVRVQVDPEQGVGGGDLQFQLRFTGAADLDLHVTDPAGEEIYYSNDTSESGGVLDHDANAGCNGEEDDDNAVENITWPTGQSPAGDYAAWIEVYDECDAPLDWTLTIRRNGQVILNQTGNGDSDVFVVTGGSVSATPRVAVRPRLADTPRPAKK